MKMNPTLLAIKNAAKQNQFISFWYEKEDGERSERVVRFGGDIVRRMEKQLTPIKGKDGKGCWIDTAQKSGQRSMILRRGGKVYVRGTDVSPGKVQIHKCFLLSGIVLKK